MEQLPEDEQRLLETARQAMTTSYSPYSEFTVGAAVQLEGGDIIKGSNQENASYGLTMCAERTALFTVGATGRKKDVRKIAVVGTGKNFETTKPVTPCGACRQVIKEYEDLSGGPITILMAGQTGPTYRIKGIDSLLPFAFGPKDLKIL